MSALTDPLPPIDADAELTAWAVSGAMSLTGRLDDVPLGPPEGLVTRLGALRREMADAARALDGRLAVDPLVLLAERAAIAGLHRRGATSVGGASRLLEAADGRCSASLARPDDVALVPAWLELEPIDGDPWDVIAGTVRSRPAAEVVARARLVGLPVSALGEVEVGTRAPVELSSFGSRSAPVDLTKLVVVELGSLWAAPLCGSLLQASGMTVIKVESTGRPDGARRGPPAFFDLLNAGKCSVALDLTRPEGVHALVDLLRRADIVIEASRPRALEHLGVEAASLLAEGGVRAWVSITGYGRKGPARDRVAFGDDAAVAGGLVARDAAGPVFCADAVADPLSGVVAAGAVLDALVASEGRLVDVSLSAVAAAVAGPTLPVSAGTTVAEARSRETIGRGPELGEHNAELGLSVGWGR